MLLNKYSKLLYKNMRSKNYIKSYPVINVYAIDFIYQCSIIKQKLIIKSRKLQVYLSIIM